MGEQSYRQSDRIVAVFRVGLDIIEEEPINLSFAKTWDVEMIPEFVDGVLPEGIHDCTIDEVNDRFARFGQRGLLGTKLHELVTEAIKFGHVSALIVDGSFVTAKESPNDIDVIVCLRSDFDLKQELKPFEYNVCSKRMIRKVYGFDAFVAVDASEEYIRLVNFFSQVRKTDPDFATTQTRKGLLRIPL